MHSETILVVDDEKIDRALLRRILEKQGYQVLEADTYLGALVVFEENRDSIALLLTDISLPGGNGCDLWVAMRRRKADLQVLFVSGHVGAEVCPYRGLEPSDQHFLGKPFMPADLVKRVEVVLGSSDFPKLHDADVEPKERDKRPGDGYRHTGQ